MSPWARSAPCSPSKCRAWRAPTSNGTGCSNFTQTLVIDEDGIYDPADFNDSLILGMKGTFAQAELHLIRARLHGGKLHKAAKGELRFSLPVGLVFEGDTIVLDPDQEVQGAVRSVFQLFEREGTAYAVVRRFQDLGLRFPQGNRLNRDEMPHWRDRCLRPRSPQWFQSGKLLTSPPFFA